MVEWGWNPISWILDTSCTTASLLRSGEHTLARLWLACLILFPSGTSHLPGRNPSLLQGQESSAIRLSIVWERLHLTWTNYPVTRSEEQRVKNFQAPSFPFLSAGLGFHAVGLTCGPGGKCSESRHAPDRLTEECLGCQSPSEEDAASTSSTMALFRAGARLAWWETPQSWKCPDETENKEGSSVDTAADSCVMYG